MRVDGFVSVQAPYAGGTWTSKSMKFTGNSLYLNFATSAAGYLKVEIRDEKDQAVPGYTLDQCPSIIGNDTDRKVTWIGAPSLNDLEGQTVKLHFQMADADLYAIQFR